MEGPESPMFMGPNVLATLLLIGLILDFLACFLKKSDDFQANPTALQYKSF